VARAAERHRRALAILWLGEEMPAWPRPCPVQVRLTDRGSDSATTFQFAEGKVVRQSMQLEGKLDTVLADLLPHEVTHAVLAHWAGGPLPRWADEGAALLAESPASRAAHARAVVAVIRAGRSLPLSRLLPLAQYPRDVAAMYAQGYSLTDFLVRRGGRAKFLAFLRQGGRDGWAEAAKAQYSYGTVAELERAWLAEAKKATPPATTPKEVATASGWSAPRRGPREPKGRLPTGPAPTQALVALGPAGRLTVWKATTAYRATSAPGGAKGIVYEPTLAVLEEDYDLKGVKVYDTRGEAVDLKRLPALLKGETPALVSADGRPVDPLHLRLVKEGTLVFVLPLLPAQAGTPPPAVPADGVRESRQER
jgi:hypothetical protein